jgi:hypothetical protein
LETLCLLVDDPAKAWQEAEVYRLIQSSQQSVTKNLMALVEEGFLVSDAAGYRFAPKDQEMERWAVELVKTYRAKRVTVIETIYQRPLDPIRTFADAFKFRKDKP